MHEIYNSKKVEGIELRTSLGPFYPASGYSRIILNLEDKNFFVRTYSKL